MSEQWASGVGCSALAREPAACALRAATPPGSRSIAPRRLQQQVPNDTVLSIKNLNERRVSLSTNELVFSPEDWDVPQHVYITAGTARCFACARQRFAARLQATNAPLHRSPCSARVCGKERDRGVCTGAELGRDRL